MLSEKNLHDRTFQDIVNKAKDMIPEIFPQWTDIRAHDPGITFVELFAWLVEMLEDYQNVVTQKNKIRFSKLLGIVPKGPTRAKTILSFGKSTVQGIIPEGTRFFAEDIPFETNEVLYYKALNICAIWRGKVFPQEPDDKAVHGKPSRVYHRSQKGYIEFEPFGNKPQMGETMYIGFVGNHDGGRFSIKISLDEYDCKRNPLIYQDEDNSLVRLQWQYWRDAKNGWEELKIIKDETHGLMYSGIIQFDLPKTFTKQVIQDFVETCTAGDDKEQYYIRCVLIEGKYEMYPRIHNITLNVVRATHGKTLCKVYKFSGTGESKQVFELTGFLPFYGKCQVKVRENKRKPWKLLREYDESQSSGNEMKEEGFYKLERDENNMVTRLIFEGNDSVRALPARKSNIMLIAYDESFYEKRLTRFKSALPSDSFFMDWTLLEDKICPSTFKIQIGNEIHEKKRASAGNEIQNFKWHWFDYERVDDLLNSRGNERHFILDQSKNEIVFGNNENGKIPGDYGENAFEVVECVVGCGKKGNIKKNAVKISKGKNDIYDIYDVSNSPASGGYDGDTMDDVLKVLRQDKKRQERAVTLRDYEERAMETPGLMIAKAKALVDKETPGMVKVIVVPYKKEGKAIPSEAFIKKVEQYLDKFRLVTTQVLIIPPEYVCVEVNCTVVIKPYIRFDEKMVMDELKKYLNPTGRGDYNGWKFGQSVRKGDIISIINRVEGVEYVKDINLSAIGDNVEFDKMGNINILPNSLVYSEQHKIYIECE